MTTITSQAALLLALLPALVSRSFETGSDDRIDSRVREKADGQRVAGPMGREGVLELLESGMISTEEALDLLDGLDQSGPAERSASADVDAEAVRRPGRPRRTARPARFAGPSPAVRSVARDAGEPTDDDGKREERHARREDRQARREERQAAREEASGDVMTSFGGKRTFRIQVDDANGSRVNLALPIGFLDTGLKVAERFSPGLLDGAVGNSIRRAISGGQAGTIIEVDDPSGQHVRIAIE